MLQLNRVDPGRLNGRLNQLKPPVKALYSRGDLTVTKPLVAIIGSRRPSEYGLSVASQLGYELAQNGVGVVSGLALGIDAAAHKGCLDGGGYTIAVMAHGLDTVQPRSNQHLADRILQHDGCLVSEYEAGTPALRNHFLARNRIVAGLADVIIVVEAAERSGTAATARFGLEMGRTIMAVPGSIQSVLSRGTNNLIRQGAAPITEVSDVLFALGIEHKDDTTAADKAINPEEKIILQLMAEGLQNGAELQQNSRLSVGVFNQTLTELEIRGVIRPGGGNSWLPS